MVTLIDRNLTPKGGFKSPPNFGNLVSISFSDLCNRIAIENHIPNDENLKNYVDTYNASLMDYNAKKRFCNEVIPELSKQGNWDIIKIDSNKLLKGDYHYNSSIIRHKGGLFYFYRRDWSGNADICVCELDKDLQPIKETNKKIELPATDKEITKFEEPRVFHHNGKLHLSFTKLGCEWKLFPERKAVIIEAPHQCLVELDDEFNFVKEYPIFYGGNRTENWEKNWTFHSMNGDIYFIYWLHPFTVVKLTDDGVKQICSKAWNVPYKEMLKGGTNPISIGDNKFLTFYHSHEDRFGSSYMTCRRYNMGALCFDSDFNVTDFSFPFLKATDKEDFLPWTPLTVFPCGCVYENGEWLIAMGVNDWKGSIMRIKHSEVLALLRPVS